MEMYVFKKSGFKKRQSEKLKDANTRRAILIDCDLNSDPKMLALYAEKDVSLVGILFEIWAHLDMETETWEISKRHFDRWVRKTFSDSNRFDVLKRLQWLSNNGLICFQCVSNTPSNHVLTTSQCDPNRVSNDVLTPSQDPLEPPLETSETRSLTDPYISKQTKQTNQATTTKQTESGSGKFFEISLRGQELREDEWMYRCFLESRRSSNKSIAGCDNLKSMLSLYPSLYDTYKRWVLIPIERRMAAFVYVHLHKTAEDPFRYALKAAEDGEHWDKMPELLKQTTEMVANKDYKVIING